MVSHRGRSCKAGISLFLYDSLLAVSANSANGIRVGFRSSLRVYLIQHHGILNQVERFSGLH